MDGVKELAIKKIQLLGVDITCSGDIDFYVEQADELLKYHLGEEELPQETQTLLAEIVAGLYVSNKLIKEENSVGIITSAKEGNVAFTYAYGETLYSIAKEMCKITEYKLAPFRRFSW